MKEYELKYITEEIEQFQLLEKIIKALTNNKFKILSITEKENNDKYFDTTDLSFYKRKSSLRIRESITEENFEYKGTYKIPLDLETIYFSRTEIECDLTDDNISSFNEEINKILLVDFKNIANIPILVLKNSRCDVLLEKDNKQVCLSVDDIVYKNKILGSEATDTMIEIESVNEECNNLLSEINNIIISIIPELEINKQSKYERGINKTLENYKNNLEEKNIELLIKKLKKDDYHW